MEDNWSSLGSTGLAKYKLRCPSGKNISSPCWMWSTMLNSILEATTTGGGLDEETILSGKALSKFLPNFSNAIDFPTPFVFS